MGRYSSCSLGVSGVFGQILETSVVCCDYVYGRTCSVVIVAFVSTDGCWKSVFGPGLLRFDLDHVANRLSCPAANSRAALASGLSIPCLSSARLAACLARRMAVQRRLRSRSWA